MPQPLFGFTMLTGKNKILQGSQPTRNQGNQGIVREFENVTFLQKNQGIIWEF